MTTAPATTCYRHPERATGRRCTRCGRPACPDCLRDAPVGAQCPECVRATRPTARERFGRVVRGERMLATKVLIAVTVASYLLVGTGESGVLGPGVHDLWLTRAGVAAGEWWRLLTVALVHGSVMHIFFNMVVLWQVGALLEPGAGRIRFPTIYVVSVLAGSAGALLLTTDAPTVGASGGVFGVAAAATLAMHRRGVRFWDTGFGPLLAINLGLGFVLPNVSLGGHVGGLLGGLATTEAMIRAREAARPLAGYAGAVVVGAASIGAALAAAGA
jgi:membrane associated rhomboid family serine protease